MQIGIVGLPNVGKSTLFNAVVANAKAQAANFPFCTIEPNVGRVAVPDERLDIIAAIGKSAKVIEAWLDSLWERLVDSDGRPITRVHGFGLTSLPLMMRYPFYSVDSSTWVQWASRGLVLEPLNGWQINISAQSSARKVEGMHIDTIPAPQREALEEIFRAQDIDTQRMRDTYVARWAWDVWAFPEFARLREPPAPRTFKREQKGLFF